MNHHCTFDNRFISRGNVTRMAGNSAYFYNSPVGWLELRSGDDKLTHLLFCNEIGFQQKETEQPDVIQYYIRQLDDYFFHGGKTFDTRHLAPAGSEFQLRVWKKLLEIPYGMTISYSELARRMGDIKKTRAVGHANALNPISIIIPCHRVIGKDKGLIGYGGGLEVKRRLLVLEGALML